MKCWIILASAAVCLGCSTPRHDAVACPPQWSQQCGDPANATSQVLAPENIERVEPLYGTINSAHDGQVSRLVGARLYLKYVDGVTSESVTRALYCHAAMKMVRGDDGSPYGLRDEPIEITARFDPVGYVVNLEGHDFEQAKELLVRARAYGRHEQRLQ